MYFIYSNQWRVCILGFDKQKFVLSDSLRVNMFVTFFTHDYMFYYDSMHVC